MARLHLADSGGDGDRTNGTVRKRASFHSSKLSVGRSVCIFPHLPKQIRGSRRTCACRSHQTMRAAAQNQAAKLRTHISSGEFTEGTASQRTQMTHIPMFPKEQPGRLSGAHNSTPAHTMRASGPTPSSAMHSPAARTITPRWSSRNENADVDTGWPAAGGGGGGICTCIELSPSRSFLSVRRILTNKENGLIPCAYLSGRGPDPGPMVSPGPHGRRLGAAVPARENRRVHRHG
jgi:hypothetical protein